MTSKTNAETKYLVCTAERLACSRVKVLVTSNKMKTITQIVNVKIKIPESSILLIYSPHLSSQFLVYSHATHCLVIKSVHSFINLVRAMRETCN